MGRKRATQLIVIPALSRDLPSLQQQWSKSEILRKIAPDRILLMDKIVLPRPRPPFDPLFAQYCRFHGVVALEPHQALDAVALCETSNEALAVLPNSCRKIRCYPGVQSAVGRFSKNVDAGGPSIAADKNKAGPGSRPG
jgi:hypothetical protein